MRALVNTLVGLLFLAGGAAQVMSSENPMVAEMARVIQHLDQAEFSPVREGWQFDYGFKGGGMLNTYEYLRSLSSLAAFQSKVPERIFDSGPHGDTELNLTEQYSFGHYNPHFVTYFHDGVRQLIGNQDFVSSTYDLVEASGFIYKLNYLQEIYRYIEDNPAEFKQFVSRYEDMLEDRTWPEDGYRTYLPKQFDDDYYWNWSETVYYFWVRRDIDGTKYLWIQVIDDLLQAYPMPEN